MGATDADGELAWELQGAYETSRELADELNAERCLWLWEAVRGKLPELVYRVDLILKTDQRTQTYQERITLRHELFSISETYREWLEKDSGHRRWLSQLLFVIDEVFGDRSEFLAAGMDSPVADKLLGEVRLLASKKKDRDPFSPGFFIDPFEELRYLDPDIFEPTVLKVYQNVWLYVRIATALDPLITRRSEIPAFFIDETYTRKVSELAVALAKRATNDDAEVELLDMRTVSTAELATAARCSESQIRTLKTKGVISPKSAGKTSQGQRWVLDQCLKKINEYNANSKLSD